MKVIYVAGPYRADSEWEMEQNFRRAEHVALQVWLSGCACICPHKNTSRFGGAAPDDLWLEGDLEMVRRCDAVVCAEGWQRSIGAQGEVELARSLGIAVFETIDDFLREGLQ